MARKPYKICSDKGDCATVWANSEEEAKVRAGELLGINQIIKDEEPKHPESTFWYRAILFAIFLAYVWIIVTDNLPRIL